MDLKTLTDIGQLAGLVLTAGGIFLAIWVYRRQTNTQVFLEYTRRYEEIMRSYPDSARDARLDLSGDPPPESNELSMVILKYLNLCSEEYYLCKKVTS